MGLSAAFEIGSAGLRIHQVAMEVMSENIANVNTPGYSRQRVILETAPPTVHNGFPLGSGVKISTVERYYDALIQKQLVNAETTSGYNQSKLQVLQQVEPAFNELAQDGLGATIVDFFNSWHDLTLNPTGIAERQNVIAKAQMMTDQFHYASQTITDAMVAQNDSLVSLTDEINGKLKDIAYLNGQIKMTELVYGNANEMRDQRDQLIRDLSTNFAVTFVENTDGTTDVKYNEGGTTHNLVTGSTIDNNFTLVDGTALPDPSSTPRKNVQLTPSGGGAAVGITPTTGKLGAALELRDTTLQGYLDDLDDLAENIVTDVNSLHKSDPGVRDTYDLNGAAGGSFFDGADLTSATIKIDSNILNSPDKIAAALTNSKGDSSNALEIAQLNATVYSYSASYKTLVAQIGLDVQAANTVTKQDAAFMKQLQTLRDSHSGVSLDEELAALIKYQRSYQASARLITTATEMMDTIIAMVR
ncbi:MAG: flagellar hook-associated protein FlgK [Trichlorobacter sp.]|nr:flagellar hook-associated protein FlgK [Trichlorobacter sp.]